MTAPAHRIRPPTAAGEAWMERGLATGSLGGSGGVVRFGSESGTAG